MRLSSENIKNYFHSVTGVAPQLEPAPGEMVSSLPLYIRELYHWRFAKVFDHEFLFALEKGVKEELNEQTPGDLLQQADVIREKLGRDVVFVLHPVPSFVRNRLVHSRISFIVPGSQMFLPMIPLDLREHFPRRRYSHRGKLLASAQVIVLYQIVKGGLENLSQQEIAREIDYSAMMVSNARDQLESHGLCEIEKRGRAVSLHFPMSRRELWEQSRELMSSPVQKTHWISGDIPDDLRCLAGISALSQKTMLGHDAIPTFAVYHKTFLELLENRRFHGCPIREDANAQVEAWRYDPRLLVDKKGVVDCFSLYLSLESDPDTRVQQELETMMEGIAW